MTPLQWKRLFYGIMIWVFILALLVFFFVVLAATWRVYTKGQDAAEAHKAAEQDVAELNARKAAVEESLRKLDTPRGVEEEIRQRYQLGKPGEEQIVLVAPKTNEASTTAQSKSFWSTFWSWIPH